MRRIWKFIRAVLHHWGILVTGGVAIGAVSLWQMTGHNLPPTIGWIIGALAVLAAFFKAWNEQYERAESQLHQSQDRVGAPNLPSQPKSETPDAISQVDEPTPKLTIEVVDIRTTGIAPGDHATLTEFHQGLPAIVMSFKNKPSTIPGQQTETFYEVTANLTYVGRNRTDHLDYGNWLDEYTRYVDFRPGETRTLVIAMIDRQTDAVVGLYNPKKNNPLKGRIRSGMATLYGPDPRPLPDPPCELTVTLVSDMTTLLNECYQLTWTDDKKMEIIKLER